VCRIKDEFTIAFISVQEFLGLEEGIHTEYNAYCTLLRFK